jgi:membrane fusion protein, multidrug efflux system
MSEALLRPIGRILGMAIILGAAVMTLWVWWLTYRHPRTDDAAVRANVVGIAPHVSGPIVDLRVVDNQLVHEGDLLFVIDERPYAARLDASRAALSLAEADLAAQHDAIGAAASALAARSAEEAYAADYLRRVETLVGRGFVTVDKVEEARTRLRAATAGRESATKERERAEKLLAQVGDLNARLEAAKATLRSAELDVGYCTVRAPFEGYVTNLNIAVGQYARTGEQVFALVDNRSWYVMANFRETYLDVIRPGLEADIYLLSYPNRRFRGVVQGIGWAVHPSDGASVDGLAAVERTLDWVRLAQRFPVRILLEPPDAGRPYRMGTTAVVTIAGRPGPGDRPIAAR